MAGVKNIAHRYAKALFELCALDELDQIQQVLADLRTCWNSNQDLRTVLKNPGISLTDRIAVVRDLANRLMPGNTILENFLAILIENHRVDALPEISQAFFEITAKVKKLLALDVTSAFALPQVEQDSFVKEVQAKFGGLASVSWEVKPEIIGGLVVRAGDRLLDSSVEGKLTKVRENLLGR